MEEERAKMEEEREQRQVVKGGEGGGKRNRGGRVKVTGMLGGQVEIAKGGKREEFDWNFEKEK